MAFDFNHLCGKLIIRNNSELPSYEVIVPAMLEHGIFNLRENCHLQPGVPLKPMLAKPTKSITEVLDRFEGKDFTCEYKYDGERAQIHYVAPSAAEKYESTSSTLKKDQQGSKGLSAIFSRNSEDLSKKYPDILAKLNAWIKKDTTSFVLDCETVAWDVEQKKVLPFQQLMTRKRKDVKAEDIKVKVCVFAFDMLFYNGESTVKKTLRERRELLHQAFEPVEGEFTFAQYGNTREIEEIQTLLDESVKASCEGLMVKMLDTEESGYEPSKRSRNWLKVCLSVLQTCFPFLTLYKGQERLPFGNWRFAGPRRPGSLLWEGKANLVVWRLPPGRVQHVYADV
jgi:DNA ligase 1